MVLALAASTASGLGARGSSLSTRAHAPLMQEASGMRHRNLGFSDILVSEVALGTQRWGGTDFNSPDEATCHRMLDIATAAGVNLVDTAEQYPIPSGRQNPEGYTERIIGSWLQKDPSRRDRLVIASKITGGGNVTPENIKADLESTLKRLGTDYLDVYLLHWPARYTPQANWGQSLEYNWLNGQYSRGGASFEEIAASMGELIDEGKIRGWGSSITAAREPASGTAAEAQPQSQVSNSRLDSFSCVRSCPNCDSVQRQHVRADGLDHGGKATGRDAAVCHAERLLAPQPAHRGEWAVGGLGVLERERRFPGVQHARRRGAHRKM